MADQIGLDKVVEVVKRFGINDNPKHIYSNSWLNWNQRLATAYSMMINGGKNCTINALKNSRSWRQNNL